LSQASAPPDAFSTSTRPDAMPPSTVPKKNGTSTDASAKTAPSVRASAIVAAWPRRANAVPRAMMPRAARKSGSARLAKIAPNATGKAVHTITSTKMSQTWLASQTGLIERCTSPRMRPPRRSPPAVRSQKPAPKSAPPSTA
jgi:hypothetical protein